MSGTDPGSDSDSGFAFDVFEDGFDARDWDTGPTGTVRLAVVGLGWFARDEALPSLPACDYVDATATVSGSKEKARAVAEEADADVALTYEEFHEGVHADAYDAVYVATPNALHLPHVEAAADLGKHVIVEKPLEASADRAAAVVDACESAGVTLMTAYRLQTHPLHRRLRDLLADGFVGDVAQVEGAFTFPMLAGGGDPDQWRLDADLAGGGSLYDVGVYPLNTTRFLLDRDPVAVRGTLSSPHEGFEGVDEHAAFVLEFEDGAQAVCRSSYGAYGENATTVAGDEGSIRVEDAYGHLTDRTVVLERDGRTVRHEDLYANELTEQFDYFAHAVLTDATPEPDGADGRFDVRVLEAVRESAASGGRVELR
ncbi:MAG: D-xylose 1-dehydrogenase Gfo6 [Halobacteriaceae archaeon]